MSPRVAIIQFPGSNCEKETAESVRRAGLDAEIIRWTTSATDVATYDTYILPGGFSYQDRVRAGAISAKLPIISALIEANAARKPILGICNGCQILAEAGIVPDTTATQQLEMALAPNHKDGRPVGFICDWVFVKVSNASQNVFTQHLSEGAVFPIPINHGEGRFVFADGVDIASHAAFTYCTASGDTDTSFPTNPNGAAHNIAGLSNKAGNALAIMPHPERATLLRQIPAWIDSDWVSKKHAKLPTEPFATGPWHAFFVSLATHLKRETTHA